MSYSRALPYRAAGSQTAGEESCPIDDEDDGGGSGGCGVCDPGKERGFLPSLGGFGCPGDITYSSAGTAIPCTVVAVAEGVS
jgi:hypothetical protein